MIISIVADIAGGTSTPTYNEGMTSQYRSNVIFRAVRDEKGVRQPINPDELERFKESLKRVEAVRQACEQGSASGAKVKGAEVSVNVYDEFQELTKAMGRRKHELPIQIGIHKGYDSLEDIAGLAVWITENAEAIDKWLLGEFDKLMAGDDTIGDEDWEWEFNRMLWRQDLELLA